MKHLVAGVRTVAAASCATAGWKWDLAMINCRESDLQEGEEKGFLPEGTLEYARGIIELRIQGKSVVKTRKQWVDYMFGLDEAREGKINMGDFPFRSYDSDMTKGVHLHRALLELEAMNKANPNMPLDELLHYITRKGWRHS